MKAIVLAMQCFLFFGSTALMAQIPANSSEINELKSLITTQQKALEQQQVQIQQLQSALAEQQIMLLGVVQKNAGPAQYSPAVDRTIDCARSIPILKPLKRRRRSPGKRPKI